MKEADKTLFQLKTLTETITFSFMGIFAPQGVPDKYQFIGPRVLYSAFFHNEI